MPIQYDFFKNPPKDNNEKPVLHPRPVIKETMQTAEIAELISQRSSFSSGDLVGLLDNLSYVIHKGLSSSQNVYIEGLGTFYLSLESRQVEDAAEIHAQSIRVKNIHFKADKSFKEKFEKARFVRDTPSFKKIIYSKEERFRRIELYVEQKGSVNITTVIKLNHCSHKIAREDLNLLVEKGIIKTISCGKRLIYVK